MDSDAPSSYDKESSTPDIVSLGQAAEIGPNQKQVVLLRASC